MVSRRQQREHQLGLFEDRIGRVAWALQHLANVGTRALDDYQQRELTAAIEDLETARQQIRRTALAFQRVKDVVILVEGKQLS